MLMRVLLITLTTSSILALSVTPVEKVITLLEDLKTQIETEGAEEAKTYGKFACFCKDTTMAKSKSITGGKDDIESFSATIGEKTALKTETETELAERKVKQEEAAASLEATTVRCAKEKAEYEANAADLSKAISSLKNAINALGKSKPTGGAFLAIQNTVAKSLALAEALDLIERSKQGAISAFLQQKVDPSDPEYKYHSQGIIETLTKLLEDFTAEKADLDAEYSKTKKSCDDTISSLKTEMADNSDAMKKCVTKIEELSGGIAKTREDLVNTESLLKDDQLYLKDLTARCESSAKDWDQRTQMRNDELTALAGALEILKVNVTAADTANKRALLIQNTSNPVVAQAVAFIQEQSLGTEVRSDSQQVRSHTSLLSREVQVASMLRTESKRLQSAVLTSLANQLAKDPFVKVKELIQKLIERLVSEATAEATKKGFCDTEIGKATKDRDFRFADAKKLSAELAILEAKEDELEAEIELLTGQVKDLQKALATATEARAAEKVENLQTLKTAKEGIVAVRQAIEILSEFYKKAARAEVLIQASPVDEDTTGAGFSGAYRGKQESSQGIIGLLQVMESDFDRTIRTTKEAEEAAAASFVKFDRTSKADIKGKETKIELDAEDLKTTKNNIAQKMADLKTAMNLLDAALKMFETLKPTCIDTGMSYSERVQKRDEEIAALKRALCILDTEKVESECP